VRHAHRMLAARAQTAAVAQFHVALAGLLNLAARRGRCGVDVAPDQHWDAGPANHKGQAAAAAVAVAAVGAVFGGGSSLAAATAHDAVAVAAVAVVAAADAVAVAAVAVVAAADAVAVAAVAVVAAANTGVPHPGCLQHSEGAKVRGCVCVRSQRYAAPVRVTLVDAFGNIHDQSLAQLLAAAAAAAVAAAVVAAAAVAAADASAAAAVAVAAAAAAAAADAAAAQVGGAPGGAPGVVAGVVCAGAAGLLCAAAHVREVPAQWWGARL